MEVESSKGHVALPSLPDDIFFHLAKYHLTERDCLALALSGAMNESYASLHGSNRKCSISQCFFLGVSRWTEFFRQHINPSMITVFNADSCYWIPHVVLINTVILMKNLEELDVLDTQVSLSHLSRVFSYCRKITRLSLSLAGLMTLQDIQKKKKPLQRLKGGFKKLTHLSLFMFEVNRFDLINPNRCLNAWPVILGVLTWCRDCLNLRIDVSYCYPNDPIFGLFEKCNSNVELKKLAICCRNFAPLLEWMSLLESLIISRRGSYGIGYDLYVEELLKWMFQRKTEFLRRLWVDDDSHSSRGLPFRELMCAPSVTSFSLGDGNSLGCINIHDPRFRNIHHLGYFPVTSSLEELPGLKGVRIICDHPQEFTALGKFCEAHPMLKSLRFTNSLRYFPDEQTLKSLEIRTWSWKLLKLKELVYQCRYPDEDMMNHMIEACPNIEYLQVGHRQFLIARLVDSVDFLSAIRFHNLRSLSLVGFQLLDGSFLPSILKQCPKLEFLHLLAGSYKDPFSSQNLSDICDLRCIPDTFLLNVGQCLPLATNLRDLRLEWMDKAKVSSILLLLQNLLNCSDHLQRLVLCNAELSCESVWKASSRIGDLLVGFATEMDHLVALGLVGFSIRPKVIRKVYRRVEKEILPQRPSFWFYLAAKAPGENDPRIPRVHYDEIVNPVDGFYALPLTL